MVPKSCRFDAAELGHQPIGDLRRNATHDEVVDALFAPAADDVVTLAQFLQEQRNVVGIVLQIAIHGDHVLAFGVIESGGQRGSLAEVAAQLHHYHAAIDRGNLLQHPEGVVATAIVDKHQLERLAGSFHHDLQAVVELGDILFFVVEGYDYRILRHSTTIIACN